MNKNYTYTLLCLALVIFITAPCTTSFAKNYKGAELRTRASYTYGRFEVSIKAANRSGMLSSFFTYHEISNTSEWNELDIEIMGRYDNSVQFNTISPGQRNHVSARRVDFNPAEDYHDYAIEWTPDYIAWFIDGEEVYRQTDAHVAEMDKEQKIMMNVWNPLFPDWAGEWNDGYLPAFSYYDWVSYSAYTPGEGNRGTDNNFTLEWRDDFDSYDATRWGKGTHTFGGNGCDFVTENIVFEDGKMILCLTKEGETGYIDNRDPEIDWARATFGNRIIVRFTEEVTRETAEVASNYIIPGVTVSGAELSSDRMTVILTTEGYNPEQGYNVLVQNISDDWKTPNVMSLSAKTIIKMNPLEFPLKINAGGEAVDDYLADQTWGKDVEYGHLDGYDTKFAGNLQISNTDDPQPYRSVLTGMVEYRVRVPAGTYRVKLKFSESYFDEPGKRIFDITVEDKKITENLDLYAEGGKYYAYDIETEAVVTDEVINIYFEAETDNPLLNGIIIEQLSTGISETEETPETFGLEQNYPNPFNGYTNIKFNLVEQGPADLAIYNVLGEIVYERHLPAASAGENVISWNARGNGGNELNAGVYFYRLSSGNRSLTKKLIYLK